MTKNEAIMILESIQPSCGEKYSFSESEIYEAIDMAIEVLNHSEIPNSFGKDTNVPSKDTVYRQDAIDALGEEPEVWTGNDEYAQGLNNQWWHDVNALKALPPAQSDGISLEWIDKHLEWLDNCDNDFAQLAKVGIKAMVEIWKKDKI